MRRRLTVTVPAASARLTTLGAVLPELPGTPQVADVMRWIDAASAAIAQHLERVLARETVTEAFWLDGRWPDALRLERHPVVTLTSVSVDGTVLDVATEIVLNPANGIIQRLSSDIPVPWRARRVDVEYQAGWLLPGTAGANLPYEFERACQLTVAAMAASVGRDPHLRSESADGIGAQAWLDPRIEDGALPPAAAALLAPWRRTVLW
jgi:hypothetical protein